MQALTKQFPREDRLHSITLPDYTSLWNKVAEGAHLWSPAPYAAKNGSAGHLFRKSGAYGMQKRGGKSPLLCFEVSEIPK